MKAVSSRSTTATATVLYRCRKMSGHTTALSDEADTTEALAMSARRATGQCLVEKAAFLAPPAKSGPSKKSSSALHSGGQYVAKVQTVFHGRQQQLSIAAQFGIRRQEESEHVSAPWERSTIIKNGRSESSLSRVGPTGQMSRARPFTQLDYSSFRVSPKAASVPSIIVDYKLVVQYRPLSGETRNLEKSFEKSG